MAKRIQLHVTGPGINRVFPIEQGFTRIGRDSACEIRLDHPLLTPIHAQFECGPEATTLVDLNSERGTRVNGQWLAAEQPKIMQSGDVILIHPFNFVYSEIEVQSRPVASPSPLFERLTTLETESQTEQKALVPAGGGSDPPSLTLPPQLLSGPPPPPNYATQTPPGLERHSLRYLNYLPSIYQTNFVSRFMAMLEAILMPIEWKVANFDLYLDPATTPPYFIPWLAGWFGITFDPTWKEEQRRLFLAEAYQIFARRGTKWALGRVLEIYTGRAPEITDLHDPAQPFLFTVKIPFRERDVNRRLIEQIIETDKPAHTTYQLIFETKVNLGVVWSKLS